MDANGNIWLFGGECYNSYPSNQSGHSVSRSDLWKYNTTNNKWTWVAGNATDGEAGNANLPHGRHRVRGWLDNSGNFCIFGGCYGQVIDPRTGNNIDWSDPSAYQYEVNVGYNDLWKYNTSTNQWTCESGDANVGRAIQQPSGNYPAAAGIGGTQYLPRARADYGYWKDNNDNFWVYGGYTGDAHAGGVQHNLDLWKYKPSTREWTLASGSLSNNVDQLQTTTAPGSQVEPLCWVGNDGNLWMYLTGQRSVWKFNIGTNNWESVAYRNDDAHTSSAVTAGEGIEDPNNLPGTQVTTFNHIKPVPTYTYSMGMEMVIIPTVLEMV